MKYIILFLEFLKIGTFAIGGGLATIPYLFELAEKYGFMTVEQLTNFIAISESTPGPVGINMATYVGFNAGGVVGAILTTGALVLPSYIIICIIAKFYKKYRANRFVDAAFYGVLPVVSAVILYAVLQIMEVTLLVDAVKWNLNFINIGFMLIFIGVMIILQNKKINPIVWIGIGAAVGIIFKL